VAKTGSRLFFTLLDLSRVNPMYRYSLPMFLELFSKALNAKELGHAPPEERTRTLGPLLQRLVFGSVSRSLFKKDRLTYAMHLMHALHPQLFGDKEWDVFTGQIITGSTSMASPAPLPEWAKGADPAPWQALSSALPSLVQQLDIGNASIWERWFNSERCESDFPPTLPQTITPFQRLLLVQALRSERLQTGLVTFATKTLGISSLTPMSSALEAIATEDSNASQPILMITTAGADPTQELEDFAARTMPNKYRQLAMGGQQTRTALGMVAEAAKAGHWLCLKNLHLVVHWVPELEKELSALTPHPDFRLWLTTEQHAAFPTIILQQSLKITFEAPPGMQKNLQRTYESQMHREFVERGTPQRAQLLLLLAWFHAVLQERRTYIPQGWTKFYEFSPADLRSAADICDSAGGLSSGNPDWVTIHGLLGLAIYGGRVDNLQDERLLHSYLQQYFSSAMLSPGSRGAMKLAPGISLPVSNRHADYLQLIGTLQAQDVPTLFGLPANADRAVQQRSAVYVQHNLRTLSTANESSAAFDREKWAAQLSPILSLWNKLSQACNSMRNAPATEGPPAGAAPVEAFVSLEVAKAKELLKMVDESLSAIGRVVRGTELLGAATRAQGNALIQGGVPPSWATLWEGTESPVPWMKQAVSRIAAIEQWQQGAKDGSLLAEPLRLYDLLNPAFFLTALRQQTARQARVPMDSLTLTCALSTQELQNATLPFSITGLQLQGALCGAPQGLAPLGGEAATFSMMPLLHLAWVSKSAPPTYMAERSALIPLYLDPDREQLLAELRLPCAGNEAQWLQAGCAMFLSTDSG